jgi:hypothetical protein
VRGVKGAVERVYVWRYSPPYQKLVIGGGGREREAHRESQRGRCTERSGSAGWGTK